MPRGDSCSKTDEHMTLSTLRFNVARLVRSFEGSNVRLQFNYFVCVACVRHVHYVNMRSDRDLRTIVSFRPSNGISVCCHQLLNEDSNFFARDRAAGKRDTCS